MISHCSQVLTWPVAQQDPVLLPSSSSPPLPALHSGKLSWPQGFKKKKKKNAVLPTRKARILSQPTFSNLSVRDQLLGSEGMSLGKPLPALQIGCAMYISFDILDTTVIICLMPVFYTRLSYIRARTMSDLLLAHLQSSCQIRQNQYMRG